MFGFLLAAVNAACPESQGNTVLWSTRGFSASVTIPANLNVIVDQSITVDSIYISGQLIVPATSTLTITANTIAVLDGGHLWVGSRDCPVTGNVTIVLVGDIVACGASCPFAGYQNLGHKVIGVLSGGQLDMWGKTYTPTWTKLGAHALAGSSTITLSAAVNWPIGGEIAIASSEFEQFDVYDSGQIAQHERRWITAISADKLTLTLNKPLNYSHYGQIYRPSAGSSDSIDMRAEVGLLTRNILVKGDFSAPGACSSTWASRPGNWARCWGAQIQIRGANAIGRIAYVQISQGGQSEELGRYPIHYHMTGDNPASLVLGNSIHDTVQRCVTVHGTNKLTVRENVAFNASGHCYFIEDGGENSNVFSSNLGIGAREHSLLVADAKPAVFWITNPYNHFYNNAAVSGAFGFWFAMPKYPLGPSANAATEYLNMLRYTPLGDFIGNTAHSNDQSGVFFDNGQQDVLGNFGELTEYHPRNFTAVFSVMANPSSITSKGSYELNEIGVGVPANIIDLTAYKNRDFGLWYRGTWARVIRYRSADNVNGMAFPMEKNHVEDSILVGESDNYLGNPKTLCFTCPSWWPDQQGKRRPNIWYRDMPFFGSKSYDAGGGDVVFNTRFYNFKDEVFSSVASTDSVYGRTRKMGAISGLDGPFTIQPKNQWLGITFTNVDNNVYIRQYEWPDNAGVYQATMTSDNNAMKGWVAVDWDGTLTGSCGAQIVAPSPLIRTASCTLNAGWNAYVCPAGSIPARALAFGTDCSGSTCSTYATADKTTARVTRTADGVNVDLFTQSSPYLPNLPEQKLNWATNILTNREYYVVVGPDNAYLTDSSASFNFAVDVKAGEWVTIGTPFPKTSTFTVSQDYANTAIAAAGSKAQLSNTNPWFWDSSAGILWLYFSETVDSWSYNQGQWPILQTSKRLQITVTGCTRCAVAPLPAIPTSSAASYSLNLCMKNGNGGQGVNGIQTIAVQSVPAAANFIVDAIPNLWTLQSAANATAAGSCFLSNAFAAEGTSSIACYFDQGWQWANMYLNYWSVGAAGLAVSTFTHLRLKARAHPGFGQDVKLGITIGWGATATASTNTDGPTVDLSDPRYGPGDVRDDVWNTYLIPLSALGGTTGVFMTTFSFSLRQPRPVRFYIDAVAFVAATTTTSSNPAWAKALGATPILCPGCDTYIPSGGQGPPAGSTTTPGSGTTRPSSSSTTAGAGTPASTSTRAGTSASSTPASTGTPATTRPATSASTSTPPSTATSRSATTTATTATATSRTTPAATTASTGTTSNTAATTATTTTGTGTSTGAAVTTVPPLNAAPAATAFLALVAVLVALCV